MADEITDKINFLKNIKENGDTLKLKDKNYFNIFNILNLREDSHSEFICWLLKKENKDSEKIKEIKEKFVQKFFATLLQIVGLEIEELKDIYIEYQYKIPGQKNNKIDIFISSKSSDFLVVIENKLDAPICINSYKRTQLEIYRNSICKKGKEFEKYSNKYFIYLCPQEDLLSKPKHKSKYEGIKIGNYKPENYQCEKDIIDKLNKSKKYPPYITIDYSKIVVLNLYLAIKDYYKISVTKDDVTAIILNDLFKVEDEINSVQMKKVKNMRKALNNKSGYKYYKPRNFNLPLERLLSNISSDDILLKILSQYVSYWEDCAIFNDGYTKIVEYKQGKYDYLYNICNDIKNNALVYKELDDSLKSFIKGVIK